MSALSKKNILLIATHKFTYFGITKTTIDDIAEALDISASQVYKLYPSKKDLVMDVMATVIKKFYKKMIRAVDFEKSLHENGLKLFEIRRQFFKKYLRVYLTLKDSVSAEDYEMVEDSYLKLRNKILQYISVNQISEKVMNADHLKILTMTISAMDTEIKDYFSTFQGRLMAGEDELKKIYSQQLRNLKTQAKAILKAHATVAEI